MAGLLGQGACPDPGLRRVFRTLAACRGLIKSADALAETAGFGSRHGLHRLLKRHRLPAVRRLAGWTRVVTLVVEATETGSTLEDLSWRDGVDPSVDHRRVRWLLGAPWTVVLRHGASWVTARMWEDWAGGGTR